MGGERAAHLSNGRERGRALPVDGVEGGTGVGKGKHKGLKCVSGTLPRALYGRAKAGQADGPLTC